MLCRVVKPSDNRSNLEPHRKGSRSNAYLASLSHGCAASSDSRGFRVRSQRIGAGPELCVSGYDRFQQRGQLCSEPAKLHPRWARHFRFAGAFPLRHSPAAALGSLTSVSRIGQKGSGNAPLFVV